jgi:heme-degrading monooxygenase HmoA
MVKVLIKRVVPGAKAKELVSLFKEMHILAVNQEGYVSAESFRNVNDPDEFLVISTWHSADAWDMWFSSSARLAVQEKIDALLGHPTSYAIYQYGFSQ